MSRRRLLSFPALVLAAVALGAALRVGAPVGATAAPAETSEPTFEIINNGDRSPAPKTPLARAVVGFYRSVIGGDFERAHALSLEGRWTGGERSRLVGIEGRSAFVSALDDEIGPEGLHVGIARLAVDWTAPLPLSGSAHARAPELRTLRLLPRGTRVEALAEAHVSGRLVGNCSIGTFERTSLAAKIDGHWQVLLPGRRERRDAHFEEWFLPRNRSSGPERVA